MSQNISRDSDGNITVTYTVNKSVFTYGFDSDDNFSFVAFQGNGFGLPGDFWNWYHRKVKQPGDSDLSKEDAKDLYDDWVSQGKPKPDSKGKKKNNDAKISFPEINLPALKPQSSATQTAIIGTIETIGLIVLMIMLSPVGA